MTQTLHDPVGDALAQLATMRVATASEDLVQTAIEKLLTDAGIAHEREVPLTRNDRIDFLVGGCGIEVKIQGSATSVQRQLQRYAKSERIVDLVLVTTKAQHGSKLDPAAIGKPLRVFTLWGAIL